MICVVPVNQNVAIHQLLISVYIFACRRSSECTCEFVMKFLAGSVFVSLKNVLCSK